MATAGDLTTTYLYGLDPIGELTDAWSYGLPDGMNTQCQLMDANGEVTLASSYTPWGDTLSISGTGNSSFGYFGDITLTKIVRARGYSYRLIVCWQLPVLWAQNRSFSEPSFKLEYYHISVGIYMPDFIARRCSLSGSSIHSDDPGSIT